MHLLLTQSLAGGSKSITAGSSKSHVERTGAQNLSGRLNSTAGTTFRVERFLKLVDHIENGPYHFDVVRYPIKRLVASHLVQRFADQQQALRRAEEAKRTAELPLREDTSRREWGKSLRLGFDAGPSDS